VPRNIPPPALIGQTLGHHVMQSTNSNPTINRYDPRHMMPAQMVSWPFCMPCCGTSCRGHLNYRSVNTQATSERMFAAFSAPSPRITAVTDDILGQGHQNANFLSRDPTVDKSPSTTCCCPVSHSIGSEVTSLNDRLTTESRGVMQHSSSQLSTSLNSSGYDSLSVKRNADSAEQLAADADEFEAETMSVGSASAMSSKEYDKTSGISSVTFLSTIMKLVDCKLLRSKVTLNV
jgi:hypothetical protein